MFTSHTGNHTSKLLPLKPVLDKLVISYYAKMQHSLFTYLEG